MFIQKKSGLVKNNTARNMTQNKSRTAAQRLLRSRWYLALINLLIIGGAIVVPGELVLGQSSIPECKVGGEYYPQCRRWPDPGPMGHSEAPQELPEILEQMQQRYPRAMQQLLKDDPRAIQKLRQALPILHKLQELAPESKEQIQQLILNYRRQHLNQSENNKE